MDIFEKLESNVRSYSRSFPTLFTRAKGHSLFDRNGTEYIDFFAGAGSLNYGHNPSVLQEKLIEYISDDGVTHSLDMATEAKEHLLETMNRVLLKPRAMTYKVMFPGPTGTNAVESALKLARKITGRENIVAFTNGFHGMTLGSLALTGNSSKRRGAGVPLGNVTHMPYCGYLGPDTDTIYALEQYLEGSSSGLDLPAAFILETVQGEGGVNVASRQWLRDLEKLARRFGVLFIVDDIQVGCGRTGPFFSFERMGIDPDIICLSKSLSGYGLPFALTLFKPEHDVWEPGEHNGTFRGHNLAFVTAAAALEHYWQDETLADQVLEKARHLRDSLIEIADQYDAEVRGRGMIQGIEFEDESVASEVSRTAFENGLIIETSGPNDQVVKCLPPLTITDEALDKGLSILAESCATVLSRVAVN